MLSTWGSAGVPGVQLLHRPARRAKVLSCIHQNCCWQCQEQNADNHRYICSKPAFLIRSQKNKYFIQVCNVNSIMHFALWFALLWGRWNKSLMKQAQGFKLQPAPPFNGSTEYHVAWLCTKKDPAQAVAPSVEGKKMQSERNQQDPLSLKSLLQLSHNLCLWFLKWRKKVRRSRRNTGDAHANNGCFLCALGDAFWQFLIDYLPAWLSQHVPIKQNINK